MNASPEKEPSLHDLSRQLPSAAQFEKIITEIDQMDGRAAALVLIALIDNLLEYSIRLNFVRLNDIRFKALFRNPTAPLSSLSAKINIGHALGIFSDEMRSQLDRMRSIRNAFAHTILAVTFNEPSIMGECNKLEPARLTDRVYQGVDNTPRERFTMVATMIASHLLRYNGSGVEKIRSDGWRQPAHDRV